MKYFILVNTEEPTPRYLAFTVHGDPFWELDVYCCAWFSEETLALQNLRALEEQGFGVRVEPAPCY